MKLKQVLECVCDVFQKYPISRAAVFGSRAREEATAGSDVDLIIDFDSDIYISEHI